MRWVSFFVVCMFSVTCISCAYRLETPEVEKRILYYNDISSVAVLPFINLTQSTGVVDETGEIFSSELARFREISVVHPSTVKQLLTENNIMLTEQTIRKEALRVGKAFGVSGVIIGAVTEYNAFFPPIVGISFELIEVKTGKTISSKTEVYDSSFNYVREEVKKYATLKHLPDSLFGEEIVLQKMDHYIRFICYRIIKKYL